MNRRKCLLLVLVCIKCIIINSPSSSICLKESLAIYNSSKLEKKCSQIQNSKNLANFRNAKNLYEVENVYSVTAKESQTKLFENLLFLSPL